MIEDSNIAGPTHLYTLW